MLHWKDKCNQHENKVYSLVNSSERLKNIEQKVLNLGIDKGLLKNMQDLIKQRWLVYFIINLKC